MNIIALYCDEVTPQLSKALKKAQESGSSRAAYRSARAFNPAQKEFFSEALIDEKATNRQLIEKTLMEWKIPSTIISTETTKVVAAEPTYVSNYTSRKKKTVEE